MKFPSIDKKNPAQSLISLGKYLISNYGIQIGEKQFHLAEIEMYYHADWHKDGSVHKHPIQLDYGRWYFHRTKNGTSYRGGNYQGLDLCLGKPDEYFGILIRALASTTCQCYVYGPSKTVDFIFSETKSSKPDIESESAFENSYLKFIELKLPNDQPVYECPRVGLNENTANDYFGAPYRIISFPTLEHKHKERVILPYLIRQGYPEAQLKKDFDRKTLDYLSIFPILLP